VRASLTRLGTDSRPLPIHLFYPDARPRRRLDALHDIVKAGKVRYLSPLPCTPGIPQLHTQAGLGRLDPLVAMQTIATCSGPGRQEERELLPMCAAIGVGVVPYLPQAEGRSRVHGESSPTEPP